MTYYKKENMRYPEVAEFLDKEFKKRFLKANGRYSQSQFAAELGLSQPTLSNLIRGTAFPSQASIDTIAENVGVQFYDVCKVPRRMPTDKMLAKIVEGWPELTKDERAMLVDTVADIVKRNEQRFQSAANELAK